MYRLRRNSSKQYAFIDANLLIYLNCIKDRNARKPYETLYYQVLNSYSVVTDVLVLDELIWISKKKYNVPYNITLDFIRNAVLPYVDILPINSMIIDEFFKILINKYNLKPSDAIHIAVMTLHGISIIVSEDDDFDKINGLRRIWLS